MAKSKLVAANKKIEEKVVTGYKKIEESVVGGYNRIANRFIDAFFTKEGESVETAKERLAKVYTAASDNHWVSPNEIVEKNMQIAKNAELEARKRAGLA